jgi:hypothetical protein
MEKKIIPNKKKKILTGGEMINYHRRQTLKKYSKRKICTYKEIERERWRDMERHGDIYMDQVQFERLLLKPSYSD